MADTYTPNFGYRKFDPQSIVDVAKINDNYDLLDGIDLSKFGEPEAITDWNAATLPGTYYGPSTAINGPVPGGWIGLVLGRSDFQFLVQHVYQASSVGLADSWQRTSGDSGATWGDWQQIAGLPETHFVGTSGEPAYQNGWKTYSGSYDKANFTKEANERVYLGGLVKDGTISADSSGTVFTLPSGFRPAKNQLFVGAYGSDYGRVIVYDYGDVRAYNSNGSLAQLGLSGLSFLANGS